MGEKKPPTNRPPELAEFRGPLFPFALSSYGLTD
jgi:hypothetical protein